jgi:hypothetical protein
MTDRPSIEQQLAETIAALDDCDASLRAADTHRLAKCAFVWGQRREHILAGTETWADQHIGEVKVGRTASLALIDTAEQVADVIYDDLLLHDIEFAKTRSKRIAAAIIAAVNEGAIDPIVPGVALRRALKRIEASDD